MDGVSGGAASQEAENKQYDGLKDKLELMHLIERLKLQKRTGWIRQDIKGPESIADHMYRMAMLSLLSEEDDQLDVAKCVQMAIVHDLAEASVGDITPYDGITKEQKEKLESDAMEHITHTMLDPNKPASKRIQALYHEYEVRQTREAKFVKDLDLLEMALQASEYERAQGSDRMQQFFDSSVPRILHSEVRQWAAELMKEREHHKLASSKDVKGENATAAASANAAEPSQTAPQPPLSSLRLPSTSTPVTDAEEEIFELYSNLSLYKPSPGSSGGLGFVDSRTNSLTLTLDIPMPSAPSSRKTTKRGGTLSGTAKVDKTSNSRSIEVEVQQDLQRLHSAKGDTGSVVWQASVDLARLLLTDIEAKFPRFVEPKLLQETTVIELGSGTGVLGVLLAKHFKSYTATDIEGLLPLIEKNMKRNEHLTKTASMQVEELDWLWSDKMLKRAYGPNEADYDLLIAVDCLYNESLVKAFVNVLNIVNAKMCLIVTELRSSDVLQAFLDHWLSFKEWQVWRVGPLPGDTEPPLTAKRVMWAAWRDRQQQEE